MKSTSKYILIALGVAAINQVSAHSHHTIKSKLNQASMPSLNNQKHHGLAHQEATLEGATTLQDPIVGSEVAPIFSDPFYTEEELQIINAPVAEEQVYIAPVANQEASITPVAEVSYIAPATNEEASIAPVEEEVENTISTAISQEILDIIEKEIEYDIMTYLDNQEQIATDTEPVTNDVVSAVLQTEGEPAIVAPTDDQTSSTIVSPETYPLFTYENPDRDITDIDAILGDESEDDRDSGPFLLKITNGDRTLQSTYSALDKLKTNNRINAHSSNFAPMLINTDGLVAVVEKITVNQLDGETVKTTKFYKTTAEFEADQVALGYAPAEISSVGNEVISQVRVTSYKD